MIDKAPQKPNGTVNICMITDGAYILPASVAIKSIISSKQKGVYRIFIITSNLTDEAERKFRAFERDDVEIIIRRENAEKRFAGMHVFDSSAICVASISALLKFIIPELFPEEDKMLYLDGDLIVKADLGELYSTDIDGFYAAAAVDSCAMYWRHKYHALVKDYFNSGIMLLNLKKMREDHMSRELIEAKKLLSDASLMDQNVFNLVFDRKVKLLPVKYNFMPLSLDRADKKWDISDLNRLYGTSYNSKTELYLDAEIIHYSSKDKPWKYPDAACAHEWRHYYYEMLKDENGGRLKRRAEKYGISVIIPCYNTEKYLPQTIDCILSQSYKDIEIILIDDGSADSTAQIIRDYEKKYANVFAFYQPNRGQGYERNFGIEKARGKYIHFMDSDDLLDPECYKKAYQCADENNLDAVLFEGEAFYENTSLEDALPEYKKYYARKSAFPRVYSGEELFITFRNSIGFIVQPGMQLIRRSFLNEKEIRFPELALLEDNLFQYKVITRARRIKVLPDAFYKRRVRENSTMTAEKDKKALYALAYTIRELLGEYEIYKTRSEMGGAVLKHIIAQCKNMKKYYGEICSIDEKELTPDEFPQTADAIRFSVFIAGAADQSALNRATAEENKQLKFRLSRAYKDKSELNAKLQQTYKEKSEINAKLQRTYKEKSAKTAEINRLRKWSFYPLLRKAKSFLKRIFKSSPPKSAA